MLNCQVLIKNLLQIKHLLVGNDLKKQKTFDLGYFRGKNYFEEDGTQNYLVFQPMYKYFKRIAVDYILLWNLKDFLMQILQFLLHLIILHPTVRFSGSCLKQNEITYNHGKLVNI